MQQKKKKRVQRERTRVKEISSSIFFTFCSNVVTASFDLTETDLETALISVFFYIFLLLLISLVMINVMCLLYIYEMRIFAKEQKIAKKRVTFRASLVVNEREKCSTLWHCQTLRFHGQSSRGQHFRWRSQKSQRVRARRFDLLSRSIQFSHVPINTHECVVNSTRHTRANISHYGDHKSCHSSFLQAKEMRQKKWRRKREILQWKGNFSARQQHFFLLNIQIPFPSLSALTAARTIASTTLTKAIHLSKRDRGGRVQAARERMCVELNVEHKAF